MLSSLADAIPCEPGYNEFTLDGMTLSLRKDPLPQDAVEYLNGLGSRFFKLHPIVNRALTSGSGDPMRITECVSAPQWHRSALYNECYRGIDCDYQMGFVWGAGPLWFGLPMNRSRRDFSDEEKQMVTLLRPHILQAHANVQAFARLSQAIETLQGSVILASRSGGIAYATPKALAWLVEYFRLAGDRTTLPGPLVPWLNGVRSFAQPFPFEQTKDGHRLIIRAVPGTADPVTLLLEEQRTASPADLKPLGLTPREAEVLFWVSKGKTNHEIALILGAATNTVRNHVEHLLKKMKVENRLAAAAIALELLLKSRSC